MPAAYAHLRFGWEWNFPGKYAALPKNFPQLYNIGLQGPDPFFFHNPLGSTATGELGYSLHRLSGRDFFEKALASYRKSPSDGALAYLLGLLGHYCLDSHCHGLIYRVTDSDNPGHTELETEFDRFLQQLDGKILPQDRRIYPHLRLTRGEKVTVAGFYDGVSPASIGWCVGNMARIYRLTGSRNRKLSRFLMGLGGKNGLGMLPTVGPNPRCAHLNESLLALYQSAAADYPAMVQQLIGALEADEPLGDLFAPTFNQTETKESEKDETEN